MQMQVQPGTYFEVNTSAGTEIVPTFVAGHNVPVRASELTDYLEGTPDDADEMLHAKSGWLGRMSAPGYLDCTAWSAYATRDEAEHSLAEMYGVY